MVKKKNYPSNSTWGILVVWGHIKRIGYFHLLETETASSGGRDVTMERAKGKNRSRTNVMLGQFGVAKCTNLYLASTFELFPNFILLCQAVFAAVYTCCF